MQRRASLLLIEKDLEALCKELLFGKEIPRISKFRAMSRKTAKNIMVDGALLKRILGNLVIKCGSSYA